MRIAIHILRPVKIEDEREDDDEQDWKNKIANCSRCAELIRVIWFVVIFPLPPHRAALKERCLVLVLRGGLPGFAPRGAMFDDPVRKGAFKPNIVAGLFRFDPLVPQDFLPFRLKFTVERGVFQQIICRR